jgi:hypothetical protein
MSSAKPIHAAATTETDFQSFSAVVLKPLLQFISTECLASLPASAEDIADFVIQLLTANKEFVNQLCRGSKTSLWLEKPSAASGHFHADFSEKRFHVTQNQCLSEAPNTVQMDRAVAAALKRMDEAFMRQVFERHASSSGMLSASTLISALQEVEAPMFQTSTSHDSPGSVSLEGEVLRRVDANLNGLVDFDECDA